jgi:hypothetical protein
VSFLLEVYGQLEEPDGLSGLVQLRGGGLALQDQITAAEKGGAWGEALALYQQALPALGQGAGGSSSSYGYGRAGSGAGGGAKDADGGDVIMIDQSQGAAAGPGAAGGSSGGGLSSLAQGQLRCLLQMGHLKSLLTQVRGWRCSHLAPSPGCLPSRPCWAHNSCWARRPLSPCARPLPWGRCSSNCISPSAAAAAAAAADAAGGRHGAPLPARRKAPAGGRRRGRRVAPGRVGAAGGAPGCHRGGGGGRG